METATIGLTLEDLGLTSTAGATRPAPYVPSEFPKEYDFSLDLLIFEGSWRHVRDSLSQVAYDAYNGDLPLWFSIYWAEMDGETEESIKASLTGVRYDEAIHHAFLEHHLNWAADECDPDLLRQAIAIDSPEREALREEFASNGCTPEDLLDELLKEPGMEYSMLWNKELPARLIRKIYDRIKDDPFGPKAVMGAGAKLPSDVAEALAKRDYSHSNEVYDLVSRPELTEQALFDLISKAGPEQIRNHSRATPRVHAEMDRLEASGGTLAPEDREWVVRDLRKVRSAIKTGRTGGIKRRGGGEADLLRALMNDPKVGDNLWEVYRIYDEQF